MRIAVYAGNTSQLDNAGEYFKKWKKRGVLFKEDYFLSTEELCRAVEEKNYSAIIVYVDSDWTAKESVFNQLKQKVLALMDEEIQRGEQDRKSVV